MRRVKLSNKPEAELPYYVPHKSNNDDWNDAGGVICPICRRETTRLLPYGYMRKRQACPECIERRRRLFEYKRRLWELRHRAEAERAARVRLLI